MDCDTELSITEKKSSIRTEHTTTLVHSPTLEMEVDSSDNPRENVEATKDKSDILGDTSSIKRQRPLTSGRVADPNCSCVLCGGTSDVPDDDSEDGDDDDTLAVQQVSPRTESSQKARVANGGENSVASSSGIETDIKNVLSVRTPSIPMKRIVKPIEEISDLSDYVSEDDSPESIQNDSDSEWTPSDEERKLIPSRTTRSSVRAKETGNTTSGRTRSIVKIDKTPTEKPSPIKNGETDPELNEDDEGVPENLISLQVNMNETVASYKLKNSKTTYSYKQLYEGGDSAEVDIEANRSDKVLVVRSTDNDEFNPKGPLPQSMVDLLDDMKTYFDHFFEKLDKLKKIAKSDAVPSSDDVADESNSKENSAEKCIETLEEDVKMFPALLNLEMVQFVEKCKQHFQEKLEDIGERYKKIRWCVACSEAALFHCCFKAAYCSCRCQKKHWENHRKECAQESVTLLDPHLRLNSSLMLRVKNLNKSKFTISDLEKSYSKPGDCEDPKKQGGADQTSNTLPDKDDSKTPVVPARKSLYSSKPTVKTYMAPVHSKSTPKTDGSNKNTKDFEPVKRKLDSSISARRSIKTSDKSPSVPKDPLTTSVSKEPYKTVGAANKTVSKTAATKKKNETFLTTYGVKKSPTVTLNSRNTSVASTLTSGSLLLPKSMINVGGITTTAGNNQVVVKFRSVTLPNGDKRLIPADLPLDQGFSIVQTSSPSSGKPATSGSILITRPAKPAYTATTGFIPLSQVSPSMSQPVILQQGINGFLTPITSPMVTQTAAPPLPTLTPIPKQGPCSVRTLNDEELNKILNTDHLQSAFDDSYYANTRIRS
uniref:Zinc finger MYND domain-containing protein 11 n=2 Tax=Lygus hesperus TaxID=30085 RepID=A0A0A9W398_LYGHE